MENKFITRAGAETVFLCRKNTHTKEEPVETEQRETTQRTMMWGQQEDDRVVDLLIQSAPPGWCISFFKSGRR